MEFRFNKLLTGCDKENIFNQSYCLGKRMNQKDLDTLRLVENLWKLLKTEFIFPFASKFWIAQIDVFPCPIRSSEKFVLKFIYSEKVAKFYEIFTLLCTVVKKICGLLRIYIWTLKVNICCCHAKNTNLNIKYDFFYVKATIKKKKHQRCGTKKAGFVNSRHGHPCA